MNENQIVGYELFIRHKQYTKTLQSFHHKLYLSKNDLMTSLYDLEHSPDNYYFKTYTFETKQVIITTKDTNLFIITTKDNTIRKRVYYKHGLDSYKHELKTLYDIDFDSIYNVYNVEYKLIT